MLKIRQSIGQIAYIFATTVFALLAIGSYAPSSWADSTYTVPHGNYFDDADLCLRCHRLHTAPTGRWQSARKPSFLIRQEDEKAVCYTCHDGSASNHNVVSEFGDNLNGGSTKDSAHPVAEGTIFCSGCHSPHKRIENFDATHTGDEIISLLRGYFGSFFGFVVDDSNDAWSDVETDAVLNLPAQKKLNNQNDMCGSCHGAGSSLPGGDQLVYFNNTSHDTATPDPRAPAKSKIKCINCHDWHGSDIAPLLQTNINDSTITGNNNSICFSCHISSIGAYSGQSMYEGTKHSTVATSSVADTTWPAGNYAPGYCLNCHNPHGAPASDYRRALNNNLCSTCHDDASKTVSPTYSYKGISNYNQTPHADAVNSATVWPVPFETGAGVGAGGSTGGQCINCHDPHGKDSGGGTPFVKLALGQEENLCFGGGSACHALAGGSQNGINILGRFTAGADNRTHHNINDSDQAGAGSKVECLNCHNVHTNTTANKNADPDDRTNNYSAKVTEITIYPKSVIQPRAQGKDSFTWAWGADLNYGSADALWVGRKWGFAARILLEFDLSRIPANADVASAVLSMPETANGEGAGGMTVELHRVTQSWNESAVTAGSAPAFDPTVSAGVLSDNTVGWRDWSITGLVSQWIDGTYSNNGLLLKATDADEAGPPDMWREYWSSDHLYSPPQSMAARPKLTIQYTSSTPPDAADHVGFCGKCHDGAAPAEVTVPAGVRQILPTYTNSGNTGEYHGALISSGPSSGSGLGLSDELEGPYYFGIGTGVCPDCHDSHGSANAYALKETVNGNTGISVPITIDSGNYTDVQKFCSSCHTYTHAPAYDCFSCHYHGANSDRVNGVPGKTDAYF